jgi:hypothetical protein
MDRRHFIKNISIATGLIITAPVANKINIFANSNTIDGIETYNLLIQKASEEKWYYLPIGELISRVGMYFLKTPYVAHTLEKTPEQVVIDFTGLDCFTFTEISLNIARQIKQQRYNADALKELIQQTRYRNGKIIDYSSRFHYTSEWIIENAKNSIITDITRELGGKKHQFNYRFMSSNYRLYPALKNDKTGKLLQEINQTEKQLNQKTMYIIPTSQIKSIQNKIEDGDIICIGISNTGLDYGHLGIAYNRRLLHASSKKKEVTFDNSISKFIKNYKNNIGITILRAK